MVIEPRSSGGGEGTPPYSRVMIFSDGIPVTLRLRKSKVFISLNSVIRAAERKMRICVHLLFHGAEENQKVETFSNCKEIQ